MTDWEGNVTESCNTCYIVFVTWLVLTSSLPSGGTSSARVSLWRRLRRLGAIALPGNTPVLPDRPEPLEALQWLAQEVRHGGGEAVILRVQELHGLSDTDLIERFNTARNEEYAALEGELMALEALPASHPPSARAQAALERLRKRHADIHRTDFFAAPAGRAQALRLARLAHRLTTPEPATPIPAASRAAYRGRRWATRPRPHVDRLASAWLIRRFLDPDAVIQYTDAPGPDDVTFDTPNGTFTHTGDLCTFETLLRAFALTEPGLTPLAEIVHDIDLRDGRYQRRQTPGVEALLDGWAASGLSDPQLELNGLALFDGLYAALSSEPLEVDDAQPQ